MRVDDFVQNSLLTFDFVEITAFVEPVCDVMIHENGFANGFGGAVPIFCMVVSLTTLFL